MTGATGFVGKQLLRSLLIADQQVIALVREAGGISAHERSQSFRSLLTPEQASRVIVASGDIHQPEVLSDSRIETLIKTSCARIVHCAASVSFKKDADPAATNVGGTEHMLKLAERANVEEFHHVSSAYQCGIRPGQVVLETDIGHPNGLYRNAYEASKATAEKLVIESPLHSKTVYRPTIVVGDSLTGESDCFQSFYRLVRIASMIKNVSDFNVRIPLSGNEPVNLVPINWLVKAIASVVIRPEHHDKTYHLTPQVSITAKNVSDSLYDYFGFGSIEFVGPQTIENPNYMERNMHLYLDEYNDYFGTDALFDTSNADVAVGACVVDDRFLTHLIDFAVLTNFGRKQAA